MSERIACRGCSERNHHGLCMTPGHACDGESRCAKCGCCCPGQAAVSPAYRAVAEHYGIKRARRSGVPLIQHIDEGLRILRDLGATAATMEAWCLHPLCQADADLATFDPRHFAPTAVMLAMEYRAVANGYLSHDEIPAGGIRLSVLSDVNLMLVADKVQNEKDFERHHMATHPKAERLRAYFGEWLAALGVDDVERARLRDVMAAE